MVISLRKNKQIKRNGHPSNYPFKVKVDTYGDLSKYILLKITDYRLIRHTL